MKKAVFFIVALFLISFVSAPFGYDNLNLPQLREELFGDKPPGYYMPNNKSVFGNFSFNGGWQGGGFSIIGGDIYAQTGYFYNLTSLNITKANLTIIENLDVFGNLTVDTNTLFVDSNSNRVGIGTATPQEHGHMLGSGDQRFEIETTDGGSSSAVFKMTTAAESYAFAVDSQGFAVWDYGGLGYVFLIEAGTGAIMLRGNSKDLFIRQGDGKYSVGLQTTGDGAGLLQLWNDNPTSTVADSLVRITAIPNDANWLNNGGNVGIGTTSPIEKLHVIGNIAINDSYKTFFGDAQDVSISMNSTTFNIIDEVSSILFHFIGFLKYVFDGDVEIQGDLNVTGNVTAENVWLPTYLFAHTNVTLPVLSSGVWVNVTFDEEVTSLKSRISHTYDDETNTTFTIQDNGIYNIDFKCVFQDSAASPNAHVVTRVLKNSAEIDGSLIELDSTKQYADTLISNSNILFSSSTGDEIVVQFTSDDTSISLTNHQTYGDHGDSATITIERIA